MEQNPEELELYKRLQTVKERVEYILNRYPNTRNNDFYLWLIYVRLFEPELKKYIKFIPYELIKKITPFSTIWRMRRKIQEEGRYLPTDPEILKKRRKLAKLHRKVIPML